LCVKFATQSCAVVGLVSVSCGPAAEPPQTLPLAAAHEVKV
jgi:hypothetical protein